MTDQSEKLAALDRATRRRLAETPRLPPKAESQDVVLQALDRQIERSIQARDALVTRASLVIPAIAAVGAILAGHPLKSPLPPLAFAAGLFTLASAVASIAFSLKCLMSHSISLGADPVALARASSVDAVDAKQGLADSLAVAAVSLRVSITDTGYSLNRSVYAGATALGGLSVFVLSGGLQ